MASTNGYTNGQTAQIDTHIDLITPENIAFQYRLAGPFRRLPAFLIDLVLRALIILGASILLSWTFGILGLQGMSNGLLCLLVFVVYWFYGVLFEALWNGQTPGKRILGIRVISIEGGPITGMQAVLRNILREVDAQPFFMYQIGLFAAIVSTRFQRLGDMAAGTMVIIEEGRTLYGVLPMNEPAALQIAAEIPPGFQASRSLARALAAYVERRRMFSLGRRIEIARHIGEPLRQQLHLPADTNLDALLCGLYRRVFCADQIDQAQVQGQSPFALSENAAKAKA